ncbi:3,4-dihydroxy-2-butanone-4-phosphate synthase [Mycobacterium sp. Z3061]|uniref:3,4-dihydroxy-2-butanone-4-phosphate synthase n=1 Tax=Mycobacterium sp. Z3061 TaxID=3073562 RepID=UPI002873129E|nr:3,4-dihydroxy-2-butanone-4-phosphate synthase [Mycobacterium sp. Z3061]
MKTTDVRVRRAITAIRTGQAVVLTDGADGDGFLVFAADAATPSLLHFTVRHTSGYVRVALPGSECARLELPPMCHGDNTDCVSVDVHGTGTGISATDRAKTIAALGSAATVASDLQRPGHVVPVQARAGGVLERRGVAEAATDLARLAGRGRAAGLCEIVSRRNPVLVARGGELIEFAVEYGLAVVSMSELVAYRRRTEPQVVRLAEAVLPTWAGNSRVIGFRDVHDGGDHLAVIIGAADAGVPVPLHVHVECLSGDVFGSKACRCSGELNGALNRMSALGSGVVLYLRPAGPPRACGLFARGDAGEPDSQTVAWMLRDLGVYALKLADDMPGFGLVLFGAIREHGVDAQPWAVAG